MRRLLVICAATVVVLVAFAVARKHPTIAHAASSNPGNLTPGGFPAYPGCALGPTLTFCDQAPGTASTQGIFGVLNSVAVTNVAVSLVPIPGLGSNFAAGDFTITNTTCTGSLAANQGCAVSVAFTPTTTGLRQAALTVTDSRGDALAINIEGTGKNLMLAPPVQPGCPWNNAFTYCPQAVGSASSAETFTVTAGSGGATGISVSLAATPGLESEFATGDFTIESTTCTGSLAGFANCTVSVSFTPTTAGLRSAALMAMDSNGDSTAIYLAGQTTGGMQFTTVVREPTPSCALLIGRQFCNEPSGGVSAGRGFTLQNSSGTQITGLTIPKGSTTPNSSIPPDFTVQSTTCSSTLAASASCQLNVAFTPQSAGLRQGAIVVTDAQGDVAAVNLAGTGDDYTLGLPSSQSLELSVVAGGTATFKAQVVPDAVFGQNGEQVTFACPTNLPTNASCAVTPCPASITAGTAASFQITFVTSSATNVAPLPTGGCSGYGPSARALLPTGRSPVLDSPRAPGYPARVPRFPALPFAAFALLAIFAALALVLGKAHASAGQARRRVPLIFAAGILIAAALTGCHHKGATGPTSATPTGATTMTIQGNAVDSNGMPLNASRPLQIILDVTAK